MIVLERSFKHTDRRTSRPVKDGHGSRHQSAHRDRGRRTVLPSGYAATGLAQIATASGAKIGSIYHFFAGKGGPRDRGDRDERGRIRRYVLGILADGPTDPAEALAYTFNRAADDLVACDYADACPIATLAAEVASTNDPCASFSHQRCSAPGSTASPSGAPRSSTPAASDLATTILATLEGAFILCRACRDP